MVREYGIRIKYALPMIQFILMMMILFFIFQRKCVKFQFLKQSKPIKRPTKRANPNAAVQKLPHFLVYRPGIQRERYIVMLLKTLKPAW